MPDAPLRIRLIGDHSAEHAGCAAVTQVLESEIARVGVRVEDDQAFDLLLVNGEGIMHDDSDGCLRKLAEIRLAQAAGKQVHLVNSVWQNNTAGYDDCLRALDGFWVRGVASARDLAQRHEIDVAHGIDLSFYAPIDEVAPARDFGGAVVTTDFFAAELGFAWPTGERTADWVPVDMKAQSWSSLVRSLRSAEVLVAGRHHGMYAACVARIPFVPFKSNTHKFADLIESAGVNIPVAEHISEVPALIRWARKNADVYEKLFDWMQAQPRWHLDKPLKVKPLRPRVTVIQQAIATSVRRDFTHSAALWRQVYAQRAGKTPHARIAAEAFLFGGDVMRGFELVSTGRAEHPSGLWFVQLLMRFARNPRVWLGRSGSDTAWSDLRSATQAAQAGAYDTCRALVAQAVAEVRDPLTRSGMLFVLAVRLIGLSLHDLAYDLRRMHMPDEIPHWAHMQEEALLLNMWRRFDDDALKLLEDLPQAPCWMDTECKLQYFQFQLLWNGAQGALDAGLADAVKQHPKHNALHRLWLSVLGEAGALEGIDTGPNAEKDALRLLPLARHLNDVGPELRRRAALLDAMELEAARFTAVLCDPDTSVAVVGNSPVELGRGRGAAIEKHDYVVRFNDYQAGGKYAADYGSRTDFAIRHRQNVVKLTDESHPRDTVIILRHEIFREQDWARILELHDAGVRFGYLPWSAYRMAAERVARTPSAGLAVAVYMAHHRERLRRDSFFGFSLTDQVGGDRKAHYFDALPPSMIHDWQREAELFASLFEARSELPSTVPDGL